MEKIYKEFKKYNKNYSDNVRLENIKRGFLDLFNRSTNDGKVNPIIIYGAGVVTLPAALKLLQVFELSPVGIIDSDKNKWGKRINDIKVKSLTEIHKKYGTQVTVIIAVRGNKQDMKQINRDLKNLGYKNIIQCGTWLSYREILRLKDYNLMSHNQDSYISENLQNIEWLYDMLEDELSKKVLSDIVSARLNPKEYIYEYVNTGYFSQNMFNKSMYNYVIDGGAYRGDTIEEFFAIEYCRQNIKQYHAFEMDPINAKILQSISSGYQGVQNSAIYIHPFAISEKTGEIKICADGSMGSYVSEEGNLTIKGVALDDVFKNTPISFIKMDIEGAEQAALLGAQLIIKKYRPVLVISAYHGYKDLWEIPRFIHDIVDSYVGVLRQEGLFEYIYIAIPREQYIGKDI